MHRFWLLLVTIPVPGCLSEVSPAMSTDAGESDASTPAPTPGSTNQAPLSCATDGGVPPPAAPNGYYTLGGAV